MYSGIYNSRCKIHPYIIIIFYLDTPRFLLLIVSYLIGMTYRFYQAIFVVYTCWTPRVLLPCCVVWCHVFLRMCFVSFLCVSEVEVVLPFCSFLYLSMAGML